MSYTIEDVKEYWDSHLNCTQFLIDKRVEIGSDEFFQNLEEAMNQYQYKDPLFQQFAQSATGKKLLEVGCGLGLELAKLGKLGFDVTGIDLSPRAVEICKDYLKKKGLKGKAVVQNAEKMSFPDESFDVVYSSGVLQHTPNIENAIKEISRVLKPGGTILIVLYHKYSWFNLLQKLSRKNVEFEDSDAPIINSYSRKELKSLFSIFKNIEIKTEYYYPKPTRRKGLLAGAFNFVFVPILRMIPAMMIRRYGWHLVLTASK